MVFIRPDNRENKASQSRGLNLQRKALPAFMQEDGIGHRDLGTIYQFADSGFAVFMHGSCVTANMLNNASDIDFAIIGDLRNIPRDIKDSFLPNISEDTLSHIDYASISHRASNGRKISMHVENPDFRESTPSKPYAVEFRTTQFVKSDQPSAYIFGGVDRDSNTYLFSLTCPQLSTDKGVFNFIPQTGLFSIDGDSATPICEAKVPQFGFKNLAAYDVNGREVTDSINSPKELMVIGLELNKMTEDVAFGEIQSAEEERYVKGPIRRCLSLLQEYSGNEPIQFLVRELEGRAELRTRRDGRKRLTPDFVEAFKAKMTQIQETGNC